MTDTKVITTFEAKVDAESAIEIKQSVSLLQDTMDDIHDERVTLDEVEFEVEDGHAEFEFRLEDDNGYKQDTHKGIISSAIGRVLDHPGNGNLIDYSSNRVETEEADEEE